MADLSFDLEEDIQNIIDDVPQELKNDKNIALKPVLEEFSIFLDNLCTTEYEENSFAMNWVTVLEIDERYNAILFLSMPAFLHEKKVFPLFFVEQSKLVYNPNYLKYAKDHVLFTINILSTRGVASSSLLPINNENGLITLPGDDGRIEHSLADLKIKKAHTSPIYIFRFWVSEIEEKFRGEKNKLPTMDQILTSVIIRWFPDPVDVLYRYAKDETELRLLQGGVDVVHKTPQAEQRNSKIVSTYASSEDIKKIGKQLDKSSLYGIKNLKKRINVAILKDEYQQHPKAASGTVSPQTPSAATFNDDPLPTPSATRAATPRPKRGQRKAIPQVVRTPAQLDNDTTRGGVLYDLLYSASLAIKRVKEVSEKMENYDDGEHLYIGVIFGEILEQLTAEYMIEHVLHTIEKLARLSGDGKIRFLKQPNFDAVANVIITRGVDELFVGSDPKQSQMWEELIRKLSGVYFAASGSYAFRVLYSILYQRVKSGEPKELWHSFDTISFDPVSRKRCGFDSDTMNIYKQKNAFLKLAQELNVASVVLEPPSKVRKEDLRAARTTLDILKAFSTMELIENIQVYSERILFVHLFRMLVEEILKNKQEIKLQLVFSKILLLSSVSPLSFEAGRLYKFTKGGVFFSSKKQDEPIGGEGAWFDDILLLTIRAYNFPTPDTTEEKLVLKPELFTQERYEKFRDTLLNTKTLFL